MARYRIVPERSQVLDRCHVEPASDPHAHRRARGLRRPRGARSGGRIDLQSCSRGRSCRCPVERLWSGNRLEDRELQARDRRAPVSRRSTACSPSMRDDGHRRPLPRVSGDLTFRGVTNTLRGRDDHHAVDDGTLRLEGASTFDIRDFGMEPPRILMLRVEPDVERARRDRRREGGLTCTSSDSARSIVDAVEQRAGDRPVARVKVRVGPSPPRPPGGVRPVVRGRRDGHGRRGRRRRARAAPGHARGAASCGGDVGSRGDPARRARRAAASTSSSSAATS